MATAAARDGARPRLGRLREPAVRGAHLLVLSAFALAQPLFDILSKHVEFFAVRGSGPADIVLFALAVTFVPALVLLAIELAVGALHRRAGLILHLIFAALLFAAFAIQVLERAGLEGTAPLIAGATLAGVAFAVALGRTRAAPAFLTVLAPAPLVFLVIFLFFSPVADLVLAEDVGVATAQVAAETPVVLVVLDELPVVSLLDRRGQIDRGRYPNFARLAGESTWFRNTTTISSQTTDAVPAILTGRTPTEDELPVYGDHPDNLFTLLGGQYGLNVHETQTRLCPGELCGGGPDTRGRLSSLYGDARIVYEHLVAPPALAERLPPIDEAWSGFGDEGAGGGAEAPEVDQATFHLGRLEGLDRFARSLSASGDRPTLDFLHLLMPHGPWLHFPSGRTSAVSQARAPGRDGDRWREEHLARQAYARHLLQLGYTDRLLGRVVRRLGEVGLYDRALVVVVADHGIAFRGGDDRRLATRTNLQDLAFVPFFVKPPGSSRANVVDRHVRVVDVVPTIADVLDVELPWRTDGRSAFAPGPEPQEVRVSGVAAPYRELLARRDEALSRQVDLFGDRTWDVFGLGPYAELLSRSVGSLPVVPGAAAGTATIDETGSELLRDLPSDSELVPSPLAGALTGVEPGAQLAVAVNGRIAALCASYEAREAVRFSALAPESAFRPGSNTVQLFSIAGPAGAPRLRELETTLSG